MYRKQNRWACCFWKQQWSSLGLCRSTRESELARCFFTSLQSKWTELSCLLARGVSDDGLALEASSPNTGRGLTTKSRPKPGASRTPTVTNRGAFFTTATLAALLFPLPLDPSSSWHYSQSSTVSHCSMKWNSKNRQWTQVLKYISGRG